MDTTRKYSISLSLTAIPAQLFAALGKMDMINMGNLAVIRDREMLNGSNLLEK